MNEKEAIINKTKNRTTRNWNRNTENLVIYESAISKD